MHGWTAAADAYGPSEGRCTASSQLARQEACHELMLTHAGRAGDKVALARSFPHCALGAWNRIPKEAFVNGISSSGLQQFKKFVNCWLKADSAD